MQQDGESKVTAESSAKHAHGPRPCGKKMIIISIQGEILGNIQNMNIGKYQRTRTQCVCPSSLYLYFAFPNP